MVNWVEGKKELLRIRCTTETIIAFKTYKAMNNHKTMEDALRALLKEARVLKDAPIF